MLTFIVNTVASLLLGFFWLRFFRQADGFEKESWRASLICLGMGLLSPLVTFAIDPFMEGTFDRNQLDGLLGFALFQVGALEEFSKILPFLILLTKTNWINESTDYIKYPAVSAIGFATTENILYAMEHGVDVLQFRAVLSLPGHVFFSSVCGYILYQGYRRTGGFSPSYFFYGFSAGFLAHGFYDFFLFTESSLYLLSLMMAGFFSWAIKRMIFSCIYDSEFHEESRLPEIFRAGRHLIAGMFFLFLFTTISSGILKEDWSVALDYAITNGPSAIFTTVILMLLIGLDEKGYRKALGLPEKN